jgi:hypothetical protein
VQLNPTLHLRRRRSPPHRRAEEAATIGLLDPARLMSGWTASRVLGETASKTVFIGSGGAPGLLLPPPPHQHQGSASTSGGGATSGGVLRVEDAPIGPGVTPLGMASLRVELSLRQRMATLAVRREERDRHFLALRRAYVAQLKAYALETKVRLGMGGQLRDCQVQRPACWASLVANAPGTCPPRAPPLGSTGRSSLPSLSGLDTGAHGCP